MSYLGEVLMLLTDFLVEKDKLADWAADIAGPNSCQVIFKISILWASCLAETWCFKEFRFATFTKYFSLLWVNQTAAGLCGDNLNISKLHDVPAFTSLG